MNFLDLAPDLLGNETIVRMALRHTAQFAQVHGFAQIHLHVPTDLVGERNEILNLAWQVLLHPHVKLRRLAHALIELALESSFFDLLWRVVSVNRRKSLAFLSQNSMAMQVAVQAEIAENVERIIHVLE